MLKKKLEAFVENIISFPVFDEIEDKEALREFLNNEIYEFYNHAPLKIKEFIENNKSDDLIKSIYLRNLGIETEDLDIFIGISLSMVSKFFINKNSIKSLELLLEFLHDIGYNISIYKIIWDGIQEKWILEDIKTGELVKPDKFRMKDQENIITSGHLVATQEYLENSKSTYTTPLILVACDQNVLIVNEFLPPSLLVAYSISKYGNDSIQLFTGTSTYEVPIKDFLLISRYIYLKWLQSRNTGFDVVEPNKEYWYLERNDTFIEEAYNLLNFLYTEVSTPQEFDQYTRQATQLLKYHTVYKGSGSIKDIRKHLHSTYSELISEIDNSDLKEIIKKFNVSFQYYIRSKISQLTDEIEIRGILTLKYLFNIVYYSIFAADKTDLLKTLDTYKRYFLPVYTEFYTHIDDAYKIKNMLMKFYVADTWTLNMETNNTGIVHATDNRYQEIELLRNDYFLLKTYFNSVVLLKISDLITTTSNLLINILSQVTSLLNISDKHITTIKTSIKNQFYIKDYINIIFSIFNKNQILSSDKYFSKILSIYNSLIKLSDEKNTSIVRDQKDFYSVSNTFDLHHDIRIQENRILGKEKIMIFLLLQLASVVHIKDQKIIQILDSHRDKLSLNNYTQIFLRVQNTSALEILNNIFNSILINTHELMYQKDDHDKISTSIRKDKLNSLDYVVATKTQG